MFGRLTDWLVRLWSRDSRRSLELRVQALQARTEDDARRLREQHDSVLRLWAIVRQYQAQAVADAAEELQIRRAQEEIRRLAELRRHQRATNTHRSDMPRSAQPTEPDPQSRQAIDALLEKLRASLKRYTPPV